MNLITRERAFQNILDKDRSSFTAAEQATLDRAIEAASLFVQQYCRRSFALGSYDERTQGHEGSPYLFLSQAPVQAVERVLLDPTTVLEVTNTAVANQRAAVQVTETGLKLTRIASGVVTVDVSVTWAANVTLAAVAAAVTALGVGWQGRAVADYAAWPSADLRPIQGALPCALGAWAGIKLHVTELSAYEVDEEGGILYREDAAWPWGPGTVRVRYTAGYADIPADVQEATAQYAAMLFWQSQRDPGASSINIVGAGTSTFSLRSWTIPGSMRGLLLPYRRHL